MKALIDTHCHLYSLEHDPLETILDRAAQAGVTRYVCIGAGNGQESAKQAVSISQQVPTVWATVGIHPHDAGSFEDLSGIEDLALHPRVVAVGETGLDFFRDWAPKDAQYRLFENSIALAKRVRKPLIIHSREAGEQTLSFLRKLDAQDVGGVFHCYSQDADFAKQLRDINFLVSFPGSITFKKSLAIQAAARDIPLEQIMLETDAPFIAPEPFRGKPSEPAHVYQVALKLAELKGLALEQVAETTTLNAVRLFGLTTE